MTRRSIITIGNFDGVHIGHRAILARAAELAHQLGSRTVAMTFDPHPAAVLRPGSEPPRIMSLNQKVDALRGAGVGEVVVLRPTPELLSLSAEAFIEWVFIQHQPAAFIEGPDFRFGKGRHGDAALLIAMGEKLGFETHVVDRVGVRLDDQWLMPVSSSLVRWLVAQGRVADAARAMAQPLAIEGLVVQGEKRGRTIGVPTANLDPEALAGRVLPSDGVYAGTVEIGEGGDRESTRESWPAAISLGVKPTFAQAPRTLEAHLIGFHGDVYGRQVTVRFNRWMRDQQPFPGVETLKAQLTRDIATAARWHAMGLLDRTTPAPTAAAG